MRDVDRALADIAEIRSQMAQAALFQGFGPAVFLSTGLLAFALAGAQSFWPERLASPPLVYFACWTGAAVMAAALIGAQMWARSQRHHGPLAASMMLRVVELFFPAGVAGALLVAVILAVAPDAAWIVPGLWQVFVALALCGAARVLPQPMLLVGGWYLGAGLVVLGIAAGTRELSPWMMGIPFAVGQGLIAGVCRFSKDSRA